MSSQLLMLTTICRLSKLAHYDPKVRSNGFIYSMIRWIYLFFNKLKNRIKFHSVPVWCLLFKVNGFVRVFRLPPVTSINPELTALICVLQFVCGIKYYYYIFLLVIGPSLWTLTFVMTFYTNKFSSRKFHVKFTWKNSCEIHVKNSCKKVSHGIHVNKIWLCRPHHQ